MRHELNPLGSNSKKRPRYLSTKENVDLPSRLLVDSDVLFSYLVDDELASHSVKLVELAGQGRVKIMAASELFDDIITALRSDNSPIEVVIEMVADLRKLSCEVLPTTVDIAEEAMRLYSRYGGSRKLHYFDSFHVATAKQYDLLMITSDRYVLRNADKLGARALDLREI
jgi:predicted nucleic acid-binding protein